MTMELYRGLMVGLAAAVVALVVIGVLDREEALSKVAYDCVEPDERERLRELALRGVDEGFVKAMEHLFDVWQRDPNTEQPKRAQVGTGNAVNAHIRARKLVLSWNPLHCEP